MNIEYAPDKNAGAAAMTDDNDKLDDLKAKLDAASQSAAPPVPKETSGMGDALSFGIDLIATTAAGTAIGWGLDRWLGTAPWLMLIFSIFGLAAGFRNFYEMGRKLLSQDDPDPKP